VSVARRVLPVLALAAILVAIVIDYWNRPEPLGIDFHTYEAAARVGLDQGWSHIYDQDLVAVEQKLLDPGEVAQPFLSPPTVAWLAAPLAPVPYQPSFYIWAILTFVAFVGAVAWSAISRGPTHWIVVVATVVPWWIFEAIHVGQVVPLVAAGVAVSWRLLREDRNVAAGLALSLLLLKPNTAFVIPLVLLAAGRIRAFAAFLAVAAVLAVVALLTLGGDGVTAYLTQLTGPLPPGADALTLERAVGVHGMAAAALRIVIVAAALVAAYWFRRSPGFVLVAGTLGSLVAVPYLHASDLCLLVVAAWIVWEERPALKWRVPVAAGWLLATPFAVMTHHDPKLSQWAFLELVFFVAMVAVAWQVGRSISRNKVAA
jgi:hypothetical protein